MRISERSSGINPAATRGFTGEKHVTIDGDVIVDATGEDEDLVT